MLLNNTTDALLQALRGEAIVSGQEGRQDSIGHREGRGHTAEVASQTDDRRKVLQGLFERQQGRAEHY